MQTFDEAIEQCTKIIKDTLIAKNKDYGSKNILNCPMSPEVGVLIRLNDKIARLGNLLQNQSNPNFESIADTWLDVAAYGVIGMMLEKKIFDLPLKE